MKRVRNIPEIWADIPEYEELYQVSSYGNIRSLPRKRTNGGVLKQRILKQSPDKADYLRVNLYKENKPSTKQVSRLVLLSFVGPCPIGFEVAHNNGNNQDNRLCNLEYKTRLDNIYDKHIHGTMQHGEQIASSKLIESDIHEILRLHILGHSLTSIAKSYNVSVVTIHDIVQGKTWSHI